MRRTTSATDSKMCDSGMDRHYRESRGLAMFPRTRHERGVGKEVVAVGGPGRETMKRENRLTGIHTNDSGGAEKAAES
jgi:hypothetical protein